MVEIDRDLFEMAMDRDVDYEDPPQMHYLDRRTGEVLWFFEDDETAHGTVGIPPGENREQRERAASDPERYLLIPGLEHGERHGILRDFLRSDWTDDDARRQRAADAYRGSIGRWKRNLPDEGAIDAFHRFHDARIVELAEEFLREHGIAAKWK